MADILLLAFPGFLAISVYRWCARSRSRAGWDFIALTGVFGGVSYFASHAVALGLASQAWLDPFRLFIDVVFPWREDNGVYLLSFAIAVLIGWAPAWVFGKSWFRHFTARIPALKSPPWELDPLSSLLVTSKPVIVSTDSGQVYIGMVVNATTDPDEEVKFLTLAIFASGSRVEAPESSGGTGRRVQYNYAVPYDPSDPKRTYIDVRNIVSVSEFGIREFIETIVSGYSLIDEATLSVLLHNMGIQLADFEETVSQWIREQEN